MPEQKTEAVFVAGLYLGRVPETAPSFIITNQTIHVEKLSQWLTDNKHLADEKGYIRLQGKESQKVDERGNFTRYFKVDTWKPTPRPDTVPTNVAAPVTQPAPVLPEYPAENINPSDIPF